MTRYSIKKNKKTGQLMDVCHSQEIYPANLEKNYQILVIGLDAAKLLPKSSLQNI